MYQFSITCFEFCTEVKNELQDARDWTCDEELIHKCLERFLYVRCYDSLEFLATLKVRNVKLLSC